MKASSLLFLGIALLCCACNWHSKNQSTFKIKLNNEKKSYQNNEKLTVSIINNQKKQTDSVVYYIDNKRLGKSNTNDSFTISLENQKLGNRTLQAKVYFDNKTETTTKEVYILASKPPKLYTYKVINTYPHDIEAYTQGLEFFQDTLYEGTGQYGTSSLRKTDYKTGTIYQQKNLDKSFFGEGITLLNDKIYQLTWRENLGFIYNRKTLEKTGSFVYSKSKEGWGLCNDGTTIYKSDGTEKIWTLNPDSLNEESAIEIYTNTSRIKSVNELEWVDGKIYANIFQKNAIAMINPKNGAVEGVINLKDLQSKVKQHPQLDVLNGIAYKGDKNRLFVTGKNWDTLFEIEIIEKQ